MTFKLPQHHNWLLIGMPGAGKSTFGHYLAEQLQLTFVDTDELLIASLACPLQETIEQEGYLALRDSEAALLSSLNVDATVIATGGSAVYSDTAMQHLKRASVCVYLQASEASLLQRIDNFESRGIAKAPGQSFAELYSERDALYQRYADICLDTEGEDLGGAFKALMAQYKALSTG